MRDEAGDLARVKAGFILEGTTLKGWCRANGVDARYAHKVLAGQHTGPKAKALKRRIIQASRAPGF
jgi:hypothetical protein